MEPKPDQRPLPDESLKRYPGIVQDQPDSRARFRFNKIYSKSLNAQYFIKRER